MGKILERKNKVVVFLGSHRSGTSLGARVFEALGLPLGDALIPGHADNLEGFWEHKEILRETRAVEDILDINPTKGLKLLPPDAEWWQTPEIVVHSKALAEIIESEVNKCGVFGFKDPRTLVLLPMWQQIFREKNIEPIYISLLRHPSAVATSFSQRQGFPIEFSEYIWLLSWSYALTFIDEHIVGAIQFEKWFSEPDEQMEYVGKLIQKFCKPIESHESVDVKNLFKPGQAHFTKENSDCDLLEDTQTIYRMLQNSDENALSEAKVRAVDIVNKYNSVESVYRAFSVRSKVAETKVSELEKKIDSLRSKVRKVNSKLEKVKNEKADSRRKFDRPVAPYGLEFPSLREFNQKRPGPGGKLKVCIAVEDIAGPIRNGGIGTTYFHLAKMLASAGHDTTIAYVRGNHSEDGPIEQWVEFYSKLGVKFKLLFPDEIDVNSSASRWFNPMLVLYTFLKEEHFDLVHCSEWRGTAYLAMSAKSMGLYFANTVFCIKASSPWLWNREHGFHVLNELSDLPKIYAEKRSIELADMVVGGSAHLLSWMFGHGYKLPQPHTYVQPNVVVPADLGDLAKSRQEKYESHLAIEEIVFFGRLEYRKGLDVFCDAIDILKANNRVIPKIHFIGKYGERIPSYREMSIEKYLNHRTSNWGAEVEVHIDFDSEKAVTFLLEKARLAVMPSLIENSSLAVYEATYYGIPFLASDSGGTPELVPLSARSTVLTKAHPVPLASKIAEALDVGGYISKPSFENSKNIATWLRFHAALGSSLEEFRFNKDDVQKRDGRGITICLSFQASHKYVAEFIDSILSFGSVEDLEFIVCNDGSRNEESLAWLESQNSRQGLNFKVLNTEGWGEQVALNKAAEEASKPLLLFAQSGSFLKSNFVETVGSVFSSSDTKLACCFYESISMADRAQERLGEKFVIEAADTEYSFFDSNNISPVFVIRKETFSDIGGFKEEYKVAGASLELVAEANLNGFSVVTIPEYIAVFVTDYGHEERVNNLALPFRNIRPYSEFAPRMFGRLLSLSKGFSNRLVGSSRHSPATGSFGSDDFILGQMDNGDESITSKIYRAQVYCFRCLIRLEMWVLAKLRNIFK